MPVRAGGGGLIVVAAGAFREAVGRAERQQGSVRVLGPGVCPVFKLNDFYH